MKRFFISLLLLSVCIVSQMQLVHAFDMESMTDHNEKQIELKTSIFCVDSNQGSHEPVDCARDLIPDKSSIISQDKESKISIVFHGIPTIISLLVTEVYYRDSLNKDFFYRYRLRSKSSYESLIGTVVKNLN